MNSFICPSLAICLRPVHRITSGELFMSETEKLNSPSSRNGGFYRVPVLKC